MAAVMEFVLWLFRFMMGASVFSFLNVVIVRLPKEETVIAGRSHCPRCGRILKPKELIPCVSFLVLRGKCLGCGQKISLRYFVNELLGGAAFVGCGLIYGCGSLGLLSLRGWLAFAYLGILLVVAWMDWDTRIIYDRFHIGIFLLGILALWLFPEHTILERLIGAAAVSLPMLLLSLLVEGAFGGGDIKLMAASGWLLGVRSILFAMFAGVVLGAVYCIGMMLRKKLSRKDQFAFGPFLAAGLCLALFWGDALMAWYLSFL